MISWLAWINTINFQAKMNHTFSEVFHGLPSLQINARISTQQNSEDYEYKFGCSQNQAPRLTFPQKSPMFRQASVGEASVMESKTCKATRHSSAFWHAFMASKQPLQHVSRLRSFCQVTALKDTMSGFASPLDSLRGSVQGAGGTPGAFMISMVGWWLPIS